MWHEGTASALDWFAWKRWLCYALCWILGYPCSFSICMLRMTLKGLAHTHTHVGQCATSKTIGLLHPSGPEIPECVWNPLKRMIHAFHGLSHAIFIYNIYVNRIESDGSISWQKIVSLPPGHTGDGSFALRGPSPHTSRNQRRNLQVWCHHMTLYDIINWYYNIICLYDLYGMINAWYCSCCEYLPSFQVLDLFAPFAAEIWTRHVSPRAKRSSLIAEGMPHSQDTSCNRNMESREENIQISLTHDQGLLIAFWTHESVEMSLRMYLKKRVCPKKIWIFGVANVSASPRCNQAANEKILKIGQPLSSKNIHRTACEVWAECTENWGVCVW